ncbi:MAG: DUF4382 domain-containing protein [Pseudomonadales bacterium]|nr:DUF4382 domain-containing protein [Pseudomonadales bacterium]
MNYSLPPFAIVLLSTFLIIGGCGGSSSSSGVNEGTLSLQITDAPVDGVLAVNVEFSGITVKPKNGEQIAFVYDEPKPIDLLSLNEGNTATLLNGQTLPAGEYNWVRLDVNADCDGNFSSSVVDGQGPIELEVSSARGLQLSSGFVITANQDTSFVIDWNLRLGLTNPGGSECYKLKPSLRITDLTEHGTIAGSVDPLLINDESCTSDVNTQAGNVVYIFEGADVEPDDIDDVEIDESSDGVEATDTDPDPVTTANVLYNAQSGSYEYMAAFLSPGDYTAAFTCQGQDDSIPDEELLDDDANDEIVFSAVSNTLVVNGETSEVNFE